MDIILPFRQGDRGVYWVRGGHHAGKREYPMNMKVDRQNAQFVLAAFAVIYDADGRVLLCHRRDMDVWNLPGGGLESRELPDEAVMREVKEETSLEVSVERLVGIYGKQDRDELVFVFECRILRGTPTSSEEALRG
jgi:ADP-ribose pyrophosphatase YjhB (NUDIX family)